MPRPHTRPAHADRGDACGARIPRWCRAGRSCPGGPVDAPRQLAGPVQVQVVKAGTRPQEVLELRRLPLQAPVLCNVDHHGNLLAMTGHHLRTIQVSRADELAETLLGVLHLPPHPGLLKSRLTRQNDTTKWRSCIRAMAATARASGPSAGAHRELPAYSHFSGTTACN